MIPILTIETLSKTHNRIAFDCGNHALNHFLQKIARQHSEKGLSKTFVLIDAEQPTEIIAYMSLVVCEVLAEDIPHQWKNKYPKRIPAAKLAKLAVAHHQQRKGYGEVLLIEAMQKTLNVSYKMGIAGLFVDAKHEQAKTYYHQFGFIALPEQLDNLFLPITTIANSLHINNE
ncbi:MAG: GNAT family N-acetyltransferase [Methylococcales bacterium]|nr:GNAT family N-acetyltransferase [Methylococcales bacterium]